MVTWATLGFGLVMLLVAFLAPRFAFGITLFVLLYKSGWLYFMDKQPLDPAENIASVLTILFLVIGLISGFVLDMFDHSNRMR